MGTFGQRLKELRHQRGISQNELSKYIGVSKSSVNMYERDEREPGFETLEAIADFFNVNMDYLLGREAKEPLVSENLKSNELVLVSDEVFNEAITKLSVPARGIIAKLFKCMGHIGSPNFTEDFAQINKEMYETFTLSEMQCVANLVQTVYDAMIEALGTDYNTE